MRTSTAPRVERALVVVCLLVAALVGSLLQPVGAAAAAARVPATRSLPAAIEPFPAWQGVQLCDPTARSGPTKLKALLAATYGSTSFGITRSCSGSTGTSEHNEGRALDWMISGSTQKANASAFLSWLFATDAVGNRYAMARRMGVMYVIWNNRMFRLYDTGRGWTEYGGCFSKPGSAYDNTCHRNHVHLSFTWDGAAGKTSYWSGRAVIAPDCPTAGGVSAAPALTTVGLEFVPLPPARLLDTASAVGVQARCRLSQPSYSGDNRRIDLQVAGQGGVPLAGATAVALSFQVKSPNAPTRLFVTPTGASGPRLLVSTTSMKTNGLGAATVPLGSGGRVSLSLSTGAADVSVDVVGYYRVPTGAGDLFHPTAPARLLDTGVTSVLAAGESRTVSVAGRGGVPASGATALALAMTVYGSPAAGGATAYDPDDTPPPAALLSVYAPAGLQRTNAVVARVSAEGTVVVRNDASGPRHVLLDVQGYWAPAAVPGGSLYVPVRATEAIDTTESKAITGPLTARRTVTATLAGVAGVPAAGVTAVALQTTAIRPTADTVLLAWRAGATKPATLSASPRSGKNDTAFVVAPLAAGKAALVNAAGSVDLRAYVVGYWYLP